MWHLKHSAGWNPVGPTKHMGYAQMRSDTLAINYAYVRHNGPVGIRNIPQYIYMPPRCNGNFLHRSLLMIQVEGSNPSGGTTIF